MEADLLSDHISSQPQPQEPDCPLPEETFSRNTFLCPVNILAIYNPRKLRCLEHISIKYLTDYWANNPENEGNYQSVMEQIVDKLLEPGFVSDISDVKFAQLFATQAVLENVPLKQGQTHLKYDGLSIRRACTEINWIMGHSAGTPELQKYQDLVEILGKLKTHEQSLVQDAMERRYGSIEALASRVTLGNINYFMDKIKITNSVPLLHQIFRAPTVQGKLNAVWKLLELFGILWKGIPWSTLQSMIQGVYSIIAWLMEKCELASIFAHEGYEWVKAKMRSDPKDEVEPQVKIEEVPGEVTYGLNDCLYDAVAPQIGLTSRLLKDGFIMYLTELTYEQIDEVTLKNSNPETRPRVSKDELIETAQGAQMKESIHIMFLSEFIKRNIITLLEHGNFDNAMQRDKRNVFIRLDMQAHHFVPAKAVPITTFPYFGGNAYAHNEIKTCYKCSADMASDCAICLKPVCVDCYLKCCTDKKIRVEVKREDIIRDLPSKMSDSSATSEPPPPQKESTKPEKSEATKSVASDHTVQSFFAIFETNQFLEKAKQFLESVFTDLYKWLKANPVLVGFVSLAATLASFLGVTIPVLTNPLDKRSLLTKFSDATRSVSYAQRVGSTVLDSFKDFGEALANSFGISTDATINDFKTRLADLNEEAVLLLDMAQLKPSEFVNSSERMAEFEKNLKNIMKVYTDLSKMGSKQSLQVLNPIWQQLNKTSQALHSFWTKFRNSMSDRQEPVVLWLWGQTNLGKSKLLNHIVRRINEKKGTEHKIFTISKGPTFWNAFIGQDIIKIDDFGSYVGTEGDMDSLAVFNLASCATYNPNLPGLDQKDIMATPKYVIVASNHPTVALNTGITDLIAFERRRDLFVRVTWPGHEDVCNQFSGCEHITKLIEQKKANGGKESFEHLTLTEMEPSVTKVGITNKMTKGLDKRIAKLNPSELTVEELVDAMIAKEGDKNYNFRTSFEATLKSMNKQTEEAVSEKWDQYPTMSLEGPPGTGKSHILSLVANQLGDKCQRIVTQNDYLEFEKDKFVPKKGKTMLIIDDMSAHVTEFTFKDLLGKIVQRANNVEEQTCVWVIGINKEILDTHIHAILAPSGSLEARLEAEEMFYRRMTAIQTSFKKKEGLFKIGRYTRKDVAKDPDHIDKYVRYHTPSGGETCQTEVATFIQKFCPKITEVRAMTSLPAAALGTPDVYLKINKSSAEFLDLVTNTTILSLLALMKSKDVEFRSTGMSLSDVAEKILRSVKAAKSHLGCEFSCLEGFFLECNNQRFLAHFEGVKCYLILNDMAFSVERGNFEYPMMHTLDTAVNGMAETIESLSALSHTITATDFLSIANSTFSPWFCLVGDLIATVAKIGVSALSVSTSISEQEASREAVKVFEKVKNASHSFVTNEIDAISDTFGRRLYINDSKRDKRAYALATEKDDPYAHLRSELPRPTKEIEKEQEEGKKEPTQKETPTYYKNRQSNRADVKKNWRAKKEAASYDSSARTSNRALHNRNPIEEFGDFTAEVIPECAELQDVHGVKNEYAEDTDRRSGKKIRVRHTAVVDLQGLKDGLPVTQACSDPAVIPVLHSVAPNMLTIVNRRGDRACFALAVSGDVATTVLHLLDNSPLSEFSAIDMHGNKYAMKEIARVVTTDRLDVKLVGKPPAQFKDIRKHLASVLYKDLSSRNGVLVNLSQSISNKVPVLVIRSYRIDELVDRLDEHSGKQLRLIRFEGHRMGFTSMDVLTRKGDCGSLLFVLDPHSTTGRIVGMHSRASSTMAYARPICSEDYDTLEKETTVERVLAGPANYVEECEHPNPKVIGRTKLRCFQPDKTKLYRNIAPVGPKMFEPSILTKEDQRNPGHDMLMAEAMKWTEPAPELSAEDYNILMEAATEVARDTIGVLKRNNANISVLSKREAINKYRHADHSEPVPVNTSAGYPFSQLAEEPGKRSYISTDPESGARNFRSGPLLNQVFEAITNMKQAALGKVQGYEPIFTVHLKDEPLKLKKIYGEKPKTRTISASSLPFTIIHRQYTHAGIAAVMDCHLDLPYAVGMDPCSPDWDIMFKKSTQVGSKVSAMDYEGWDFKAHPELVRKVLPHFWNMVYQAIDKKWTEDDDRVRDYLYDIMSKGVINVGGLLFRIKRGILSGVPSTAIDNSIMNHIMKVFSWKKIMAKKMPALVGYDHFKMETYSKFYGDDFYLVLSNYIAPIFNSLSIRDVEEAVFGVKLTAADKESEIVAHQAWNEISFLSRQFKIYGGRCYGVLEWHRVCKSSWWVHDSRSHRFWESPDDVVRDLSHAESSYESALMEAVMHGFARYEEIRKPAQDALWKLGSTMTLPSFTTLYAELHQEMPPLEMKYGVSLHTVQNTISKFKPPSHARVFQNRTSWSYGQGYSYPGARHPSTPIPGVFQKLLDSVNEQFDRCWNSVLINVYPPGGEIPWHYDDEPELDIDEGVGCLTAKGGGQIHLKANGQPEFTIDLRPDDFYLMERDCLRHFRHKRDKHKTETVSITFRKIDE